jgi:hypothetical protein
MIHQPIPFFPSPHARIPHAANTSRAHLGNQYGETLEPPAAQTRPVPLNKNACSNGQYFETEVGTSREFSSADYDDLQELQCNLRRFVYSAVENDWQRGASQDEEPSGRFDTLGRITNDDLRTRKPGRDISSWAFVDMSKSQAARQRLGWGPNYYPRSASRIITVWLWSGAFGVPAQPSLRLNLGIRG